MHLVDPYYATTGRFIMFSVITNIYNKKKMHLVDPYYATTGRFIMFSVITNIHNKKKCILLILIMQLQGV